MVVPYDVRCVPCMERPVGLARGLVELGHRPVLVHFIDRERRERGGVLRAEPEGVECHALDSPRWGLGSTRRALRALATQAEIIHFQKCHPHAALAAVAVAEQARLPLHYDWDDDEVSINRETWRSKTGHDSPFWLGVWGLERILPTFPSTVSVSSEALRKRALAYGVHDDRIVWVPVGADLSRFHPAVSAEGVRQREQLGDGLVVTYVGQLEGVSHVETLLEAARLLGGDVRWLVVGGGFQQAELERRAHRLGIGARVHFTGFRPSAEIPSLLAASDVVVAQFEDTPATRAKSPLKIAEYLAMGKPIVASAVGEIPRMVGDAGLLVEDTGAGCLATAIGTLLSTSPEQRSALGRAGRRRAEEIFNWTASARHLLRAYTLALEGPC